MAVTSLVIHQIKVRKDHSRTDCLVAKYDGKNDLFVEFGNYLGARRQKIWAPSLEKKVLKIASFSTSGRYIAGRMQSGDYGYRAELLNVKSGSIDYTQTPSHSALQPFYFLLHVPTDQRVAFAITQRSGIYGATGAFQSDFEEYFHKKAQEYHVKFEVAIPEAMVREFLESGEIMRIRFLSKTAPKEIEDVVRSGGIKELQSELIISAKKGAALKLKNAVLNAVQSRQDIRSYITLSDFKYDDVKIEFKNGKKKKTMRLTDVLQLRPEIDISNDVVIDSNGHPTFESVDNIAREWLGSLLKSLESEQEDVSED